MSLPKFLVVPLVLSWSAAMAQPSPATVPVPASVDVKATAPQPTTADLAHAVATASEGAVVSGFDLLSELQRAPAEARSRFMANPDSLQQLASNLMVRRLLAQEAQRDGLDKDPLVAAAITIAHDRVLSDARLQRLDAQNAPSDAALDAYARDAYKASGARFDVPAQTRASHILLANTGPESLQKAKDLLAQLRAGASFEELAKANSSDTASAARGGDLGFFGAGKMVRPFEEAVNGLAKPGDLSEPVESQFGYHIIRLDERKDKSRQSYDVVRPQLLAEARTAILNEARVGKVGSLNKTIQFDRAAIEGLSKSGNP